MDRDYVNLIVGGIFYSLFLEDIEKYPESYFSAVIKKEWSPEHDSPIKINRDGRIFRYIVEFHHQGELPFKSKTTSFDLLKRIQEEGDFYNLPLLVEATEKYLASCISKRLRGRNVECQFWSEASDELVNVTSALWAPFSHKGVRSFERDITLFKSSTLLSLSVDELCEAATPAQFSNGSDNLMDPAVRDALEISADKLSPELWEEFKADLYPLYAFAPRINMERRPRKLVIYRVGGHCIKHVDNVHGDGHVGTLVHILNSEFTGGELVVWQNETEVSISKPGEWMAMYDDALYRINPVTSGTRVVLIFDLYDLGPMNKKEYFHMSDFYCATAEAACELTVRGDLRANFYAALNTKLETFEDVVICLQSLYLWCPEDPACLRNGDALLYQLLAEQESGYDVSIVPFKIKRSTYHYDLTLCYVDGEEVDLNFELSDDRDVCEQRRNRKTLLSIPFEPHDKTHPAIGYFYMRNHYSPEVAVYLASGLRISKREASVNPLTVQTNTERYNTEGLTRAVSVSSDPADHEVKKVTLG